MFLVNLLHMWNKKLHFCVDVTREKEPHSLSFWLIVQQKTQNKKCNAAPPLDSMTQQHRFCTCCTMLLHVVRHHCHCGIERTRQRQQKISSHFHLLFQINRHLAVDSVARCGARSFSRCPASGSMFGFVLQLKIIYSPFSNSAKRAPMSVVMFTGHNTPRCYLPTVQHNTDRPRPRPLTSH